MLSIAVLISQVALIDLFLWQGEAGSPVHAGSISVVPYIKVLVLLASLVVVRSDEILLFQAQRGFKDFFSLLQSAVEWEWTRSFGNLAFLCCWRQHQS